MVARRLLSILLLLILVALVGGAPASTMLAQPSVDEQLDQIQQRVTQIRQLDFTTPVQREFMSHDALRAYNEETFYRDNSPEELDAVQTLLETLGYIPKGLDITSLLLDVLSEEVLGFYDPQTKSIYVISDEGRLSPDETVTFAHEMTHALQDQHWDLHAQERARQDNNDQTLAFRALEEGDAVLSQTLYSLRYVPQAIADSAAEAGSTALLDASPLIVRRELLFPYEDGSNFLVNPFLTGSWDAIDAIWDNPPTSTAQILHPDKYFAGQQPVELPLPDLASKLGDEWKLIDDDNLGELDIRTLIEQFVDRSTADKAAAGWAGDHYEMFRRDSDGAAVFAFRSAWDTETDAREFFDAYKRAAAGRHGTELQTLPTSSLNLTGHPDDAWLAQAGSFGHALALDGTDVALVVFTDPVGASVLEALRP